jgi:uncharacterized protein (DUF488 family)
MGQTPTTAEITVWTIGHSNHPWEAFLALLRQHGIAVLVDARSSPYARYASQFNQDQIAAALQGGAIKYLYLGNLLGGRVEGRQFYDEQGHVLYDRVARSPGFQQGISRLLECAAERPTAVMCGEEDPTDCHRRLLVGRVLRGRGVRVIHIRGDGRAESEEEVAEAAEFAKTRGQMTLFDLEETDEWKSTRSVLPKDPPANSSRPSSERESGG